MCRVIRRVLGLGVIVVALGAVAGSAVAAAPEGPRLALTEFGLKPLRLELLTIDQTGGTPARIAGGGKRSRPLLYPFSAPSWSPDGALIAFSAVASKIEGDEHPRLEIFVASSDGSGIRPVPGTSEGYGPVFAPDGRTIAFARAPKQVRPKSRDEDTATLRDRPGGALRSVSAWLVDIDGGEPRQLTKWRDGLNNFPSSFSPDGSLLAMTRVDERRAQDREAVVLQLGTGRVEVLSENGSEPAYSPDGSQIALLRTYVRPKHDRGKSRVAETSDLYLLGADGSHLRRLTDTPAKREVAPSWDPSGQRLAYAQFRGDESEASLFGFGGAIMEINADGTCRTKVLSARETAVYGPVWQPGAGREAGRIECAG